MNQDVKTKPKTIGIDARLYGPACKGLGRYVEEIVNGVTEIDKENNYVIFLSPDSFDLFVTSNPRVRKVMAKSRWYTLAEQITMPYLIWKEKVDLMHFPHFNVPIFCTAPFVVTIHDLILTKFPSKRATTLSPLLYNIKYFFYKIIISSALRRAKKIIAISQYTKNDIVEQFNVKAEKIVVTYEGVTMKLLESNNLNTLDILEKYKINKPFIMYVGNAYPHKNLEGLIDEFVSNKFVQPDLSLVFVGGEDYFYKRLKTRAANEKISNIIFAGFVPDNELICLYKEAHAYVFPSKFEGFGLPPLEAMQQACVVLSSDKTCLPEILGDAAVYFNPDDSGWLKTSLQVIENKEKREELIKNGFLQVKIYSWENCVRETLGLYYEIL